MSPQPQSPPEVFVSYSHLDSEYKEHLVKQLDVLAEQKIISQWHDGLLVAGERWNDEIVKRLNSSRVILLLISVDFLTSLYVNDVEIKEASRRYQAGGVTVIPVLVRNVHGWEKKPFGEIKLGDLQALPSNSKFLKGWRDRDDAFANVAEGIQKAVEKLKPITKTPISPSPSVPTSHQTDYVKDITLPPPRPYTPITNAAIIDSAYDDLRSKLVQLQQFVQEELIDEGVKTEYQRRLLDKWVEK